MVRICFMGIAEAHGLTTVLRNIDENQVEDHSGLPIPKPSLVLLNSMMSRRISSGCNDS